MEAACASMDSRHLPFSLPGKPLDASAEVWVRVKYALALALNTVLGCYLLSLLACWPWAMYIIMSSVAWQLISSNGGVDRIMVGLEW